MTMVEFEKQYKGSSFCKMNFHFDATSILTQINRTKLHRRMSWMNLSNKQTLNQQFYKFVSGSDKLVSHSKLKSTGMKK